MPGTGTPNIRAASEATTEEAIAEDGGVTSLYRLLSYARPYRARLAGAVIAMAVYGAGTAGIASLIQLIFDEVLAAQRNLGPISVAILALYFFKGVGSYLSSYLMADVGHQV
jgi:ABC-type multidrug transport system fused ATPase/permease subunit